MNPSKETLDKVRKLATKNDSWMTPTDDDNDGDFSEYQDRLREAWEETTHFDLLYRQPIIKLGYEDAYAQGFNESDYKEPGLAFYEMFQQPLMEAFWDQWDEIWELHKYWHTNVQLNKPICADFFISLGGKEIQNSPTELHKIQWESAPGKGHWTARQSLDGTWAFYVNARNDDSICADAHNPSRKQVINLIDAITR